MWVCLCVDVVCCRAVTITLLWVRVCPVRLSKGTETGPQILGREREGEGGLLGVGCELAESRRAQRCRARFCSWRDSDFQRNSALKLPKFWTENLPCRGARGETSRALVHLLLHPAANTLGLTLLVIGHVGAFLRSRALPEALYPKEGHTVAPLELTSPHDEERRWMRRGEGRVTVAR